MTEAEAILQFRREYWLKLLIRTDGNITLAAKIAGRSRTSSHRILRDLGFEDIASHVKVGKWDRPTPTLESAQGSLYSRATPRRATKWDESYRRGGA